ncbi:4-(cytidine 5'-diphospho)-2-C-methyl-D-erythritol kinase [Streptomyces rimosus]|uniref:4-(cytidine 5'-diphospho)-2-C-methyl-D-erythritol kinase n=1 Tax=Streptomyces rimosus TaxID=1927 RepID=UPI000B318851|nr:4-(cytidine 5'-diphospho)-2-C-methyl-D-erythritol kinase [Streptomyces rimosus]
MTVRVPAKVNLQLSVGRQRPDGYHELLSIFMAVGLFDEVYVTDGEGLSCTAGGEGSSDLPGGDHNLAVRAARLLAARTGAVPGARLHINKGIPVAGGMAGGSADAAAALLACDTLWGTRLAFEDLRVLAAELGSDVPFCLAGGLAVGRGRGEIVAALPEVRPFHWVLALGREGLSTPEVFAELDRIRRPSGLPPRPVGPDVPPDAAILRALRDNDVASLAAALHNGSPSANDLQAAALSLRPSLAATLRAGRRAGACAAFVSGSGPTCVFLAEDAPAAEHIKAELEKSGTCRAATTTVGPVPGPTVQIGGRHL